jgi:predicted nucleotidyltransferase component of viral defense system
MWFRKSRLDINTREHFTALGFIKKAYKIEVPWYSGQANVVTYPLEELLGTKLRALFQRKKGRDLFDLAVALRELEFDVASLIYCFYYYLERQNVRISRAEFEENLRQKEDQMPFREDMQSLMADSQVPPRSFQENFDLVMHKIIQYLPGEAWKGQATKKTIGE